MIKILEIDHVVTQLEMTSNKIDIMTCDNT